MIASRASANKSGASPPKPKSKAPVAPAGSAPTTDSVTAKGKSIFLFADGTGNSSAKAFKTNVWRMYEAIDLGLASPGAKVQIAYYDNGVGTSAFRPLRLLGGIFGIGLAANVRRIYSFLCRNYVKGDTIYAFGFSRGAFTIRLVVAIIARFGIIDLTQRPRGKEGAIESQVREVYREYRRRFLPNRWLAQWLVRGLRALRDLYLLIKRKLLGRGGFHDLEFLDSDIAFVGVWDTVAAYGGPFAEVTRGIDDWVWPLSMPDYALSPKVLKARHALSLDDERDAFWPLLWDEAVEKSRGDAVPDRLQQVWFAGVHSDVGGGYPDESLSYISLLWMMDELGKDVDFVDSSVQRAKDMANPYGPIHDSRAGLGAYYRYQPRKIAAFMQPFQMRTCSMRDPQLDGEGKPRGLLEVVRVHESALARVISGIDNYAPSALPADFEIVTAIGPHASPALTAQGRNQLDQARPHAKPRENLQENAWDYAWQRRGLYFLTVGVTLFLLALPLIAFFDPVERLCNDDRCFAEWTVSKLFIFLPSWAGEIFSNWTAKPVLLLTVVLLIAMLIAFGRRRERKFRDAVKSVWDDYLDRKLPIAAPSTKLRTDRESPYYQRSFHWLKWRLLPTIAGIVIFILLALAATIVASQTLYAVAEPHAYFCKDGEAPAATFDIAQSCTDLGFEVTGWQQYRLVMTPKLPWNDGWTRILGIDVDEIEARPDGGATKETIPMMLARPLKRVTNARWLQPVTEVRADHTGRLARWQWLVGKDVELREVNFADQGNGTYLSGELCPRRSGRLHLMVNDAAPLLSKALYANNGGTATVTLIPTGHTCKPFSERRAPAR